MPIRRSPNGARHVRSQPGRNRPERVVAINRNAWSQSVGTGGRNHPVRAIETLRHAFPRSANIDQAINKLETELNILKLNPPSTVSQLMGIEGRVGYAYFNSWRTCQIKWKGTDRNPIPDDWYKIERRSSKLGSTSRPNRNATHPINAMLNYAYGVLESQVRMQVVAAGLDPTIGILHGNAGGKHGLVFDLMEPLRPIVDRQVLQFIQSRAFHPTDFIVANKGSCRLNPELARNLIRAVASFQCWKPSLQ